MKGHGNWPVNIHTLSLALGGTRHLMKTVGAGDMDDMDDGSLTCTKGMIVIGLHCFTKFNAHVTDSGPHKQKKHCRGTHIDLGSNNLL